MIPSGGVRGQTTVVTIDGKNLASAAVKVSGPGVVVQSVNANPNCTSLAVALAVSSDASFGPHDLRVVTPRGIAHGVRFWVDLFPNFPPPGAAAVTAAAPLLPRDRTVVVNGRIADPSARDRYQVQALAGETWAFDCFAARLGSKLEAVLELRDERGDLLKQAQLEAENDPRFAHKFTKPGKYTVAVRDIHSGGGPEFVYRLLVGKTAFITRFLPRGERPGSTVGIQMEGPNVPARTPATVVIPKTAHKGIYWADVRTPTGRAALIPFLVDDLAAAAVTETDFTMPLPLPPVALDGTFARYPRIRFFFRAEKGERYEFTLLGRRIGSAIKSGLRVLDSTDGVAAEALELSDHEARIEFSPGEEGIFTLEARDADGKIGADRYYRLNVRQIGLDFGIAIGIDRVAVPARGSAVITVKAERKGGYTGPIAVRLDGLPPDVVSLGGAIPEGRESADITVTSSRAAPVSSIIRVLGEATIGGKSVVREAQPREAAGAGQEYRMWDMLILAVVEPAHP